MPPSGRARKPIAKPANAARVPISGSPCSGKNNGPKIRAAAVPYRKKSYHSSALPITEATMIRRSVREVAGAAGVAADTAEGESVSFGIVVLAGSLVGEGTLAPE